MNTYPRPEFEHSPRRRRPSGVVVLFFVALAVISVAVGALAFTITHRDTETPPASAAPAASVTTTPPMTTTTTTPPTTTPAPPSLEQFVRDLYGALPGGTDQAWSMFDERYAATTGKANFVQFWSTIRSVSVLSVTPRDATTVIARIRYVTNGGRVDTENRSLTMVTVQGKLFVDDSVRLGPA